MITQTKVVKTGKTSDGVQLYKILTRSAKDDGTPIQKFGLDTFANLDICECNVNLKINEIERENCIEILRNEITRNEIVKYKMGV